MDPTQQQQHRQQQVQVKSETTTSSSGAAYLLHQLQVGGTTGYTVGVPPSQQQQHPQQQLGVPAQQQFQLISSAPTQLTNFIFPGSNMTMTQTIQSATQAENVPRMQQLTPQQQFNERERQIKRRTKTGCMTCRKRRIKCDEGKPFCYNCQKSHRECEGYQSYSNSNSGSKRSESNTPPGFTSSAYTSDYSTPSANLSGSNSNSTFSPINQRRGLGATHSGGSPRFAPYDVYPRTPIEQSLAKEFDPLSGNEYLATDFANEHFLSDFPTSPMKQEDLSTPPPTARISIDSLLNLSSAALIHPAIDAPLDALFSPTASLTPPALLKPNNLQLFAHWINILSPAMATLDRFPTDSSILETTPGIHYPLIRVPHEDAVYSFLIPHLAMAPTGTGLLYALLACAASHRQDRRLGQKNYHLAVRALRQDIEHGVSYFVAVTLLGMYEVLGGKGIRCMYLAKDWILQHKAELMAKMQNDDMEVTVRDVIIENMKWTFARTAVHRGISSLLAREGFILPMNEFRDLYIPREGSDSTVGVADSLVILLAQVISLPTLGEGELKAHIANQLYIWPSTLPRMFRHQWTSQTPISTTSLNALHFLHPSMAAIHLLHRAGIIYFSIAFNFHISRKSSPQAIAAARDVLRITQPLIDDASSGRWSVLGALTLAFGPVFIAGQFLKFHLRDTPFVLPNMDWLDESLGEIVETEEDVELREVERMIEKLKVYLGGVEGRVIVL